MKKLSILIATISLLLVPAIASANLLGDAGFEGSGAGPWATDNWGGPWDNDYDATDQVHGGSQSLKQVANGTNDAGGWEKTEAKQIFSVQPGDIITGGAWLKWENLSQVEAKIECKWLDAGQNELGSGIGTAAKTSGSGDWEYQDLTIWTVAERTAPSGSAYVDYRLFLLAPGSASTATGSVWWDDAEFDVIPEPTSLMLFSSGLLGLLAFSRRKRG